MDTKSPILLPKSQLSRFGEWTIDMNVSALIKTATYILEHKNDFKVGDFFRVTGIDGKTIKFLLKS